MNLRKLCALGIGVASFVGKVSNVLGEFSTLNEDMSRLSEVSRIFNNLRGRGSKDVHSVELLSEVKEVAHSYLGKLQSIQKHFQDGDSIGAASAFTSMIGNIDVEVSKELKAIHSPSKSTDSLVKGGSTSQVVVFLQPKVFDELAGHTQDLIHILEDLHPTRLPSTDKDKKDKARYSQKAFPQDTFQSDTDPLDFNSGAHADFGSSTSFDHKKYSFDHSSVHELQRKHQTKSRSSVSSMGKLLRFHQDENIVVKHEIRLNALNATCKSKCELDNWACNCKMLFGCVGDLTEYDLAVLTAGGFINTRPESEKFGNFTVPPKKLDLFDTDQGIGETLKHVKNLAKWKSDTTREQCKTVLEEFHTACDPNEESCSSANQQSFPVTTKKVCDVVNTPTKLLFEVIGDEFDNLVDAESVGKCKPLSYDICADFASEFDKLYRGRNEEKYPDENPMRVPGKQWMDDQVLNTNRFPVGYNFKQDEGSGVVERVFRKISTDNQFYIKDSADNMALDVKWTSSRENGRNENLYHVLLRDFDGRSASQMFHLEGDMIICSAPKDIEDIEGPVLALFIDYNDGGCTDGMAIQVGQRRDHTQFKWRFYEDGSIRNKACPHFVLGTANMEKIDNIPTAIQFRLVNPSSGLVLQREDDGMIKVQKYDDSEKKQHFYFVDSKIFSVVSSSCPIEMGTDCEKPLDLAVDRDCSRQPEWKLNEGYIESRKCSGKVLDIPHSQAGTKVILQVELGGPNQQWQLKATSDHAFARLLWAKHASNTKWETSFMDSSYNYALTPGFPDSTNCLFETDAKTKPFSIKEGSGGEKGLYWPNCSTLSFRKTFDTFYYDFSSKNIYVATHCEGKMISVKDCSELSKVFLSEVNPSYNQKWEYTHDGFFQSFDCPNMVMEVFDGIKLQNNLGGSNQKWRLPELGLSPNDGQSLDGLLIDAKDSYVSKSAMNSCDKSMSLLVGSKTSIGTLRAVAALVEEKGPGRMPGECCMDNSANSQYFGYDYDPAKMKCEHRGPWHLGFSKQACDNVGGHWTRTPCITLKECIESRPERFLLQESTKGNCQDGKGVPYDVVSSSTKTGDNVTFPFDSNKEGCFKFCKSLPNYKFQVGMSTQASLVNYFAEPAKKEALSLEDLGESNIAEESSYGDANTQSPGNVQTCSCAYLKDTVPSDDKVPSFVADDKFIRTPAASITCYPYERNPSFSRSFETFAQSLIIEDASDEDECRAARQGLNFDRDWPFDTDVRDEFNEQMCDLLYTGLDHKTQGLEKPVTFTGTKFEPVSFDPEPDLPFDQLPEREKFEKPDTLKTKTDEVTGAAMSLLIAETVLNKFELVKSWTDTDECKLIPKTIFIFPNPFFYICNYAQIGHLVFLNLGIFAAEITVSVFEQEFFDASLSDGQVLDGYTMTDATYNNFQKFDQWITKATRTINKNIYDQHKIMGSNLQTTHEMMLNCMLCQVMGGFKKTIGCVRETDECNKFSDCDDYCPSKLESFNLDFDFQGQGQPNFSEKLERIEEAVMSMQKPVATNSNYEENFIEGDVDARVSGAVEVIDKLMDQKEKVDNIESNIGMVESKVDALNHKVAVLMEQKTKINDFKSNIGMIESKVDGIESKVDAFIGNVVLLIDRLESKVDCIESKVDAFFDKVAVLMEQMLLTEKRNVDE